MGTKCSCIGNNTSDEAEDALLGNSERERDQQREGRGQPRGPPPPYQVHPFYMLLTDEQRLHLVTRLTLIQSLPVGRYTECKKTTEKKSYSDSGKRECPICMNDFIPGELIRLLPCMHFYHIRCIDDWLMRAVTCPTCVQRVDMPTTSNNGPRQVSTLHRRSNSRESNISNNNESTSTERLCSPSCNSNITEQITAEVH